MSVLAVFGAIAFFVGILASVALHEIGHLVPAKLFGVKVTPVLRRLRQDALVDPSR